MKTKHRRGFKQASAGTLVIMGGLWAAHRIRKSLGRVKVDAPAMKTAEDTVKLGLRSDVVDSLPRRGLRYDNGRLNESMNLVLFGTAEEVYDTWAEAGWYAADPVTPWSLLKSFIALVFNLQYKHGPVTPIMANGHQQEMSFQKPTDMNKFRQRHHARVWSTPYASTSGRPVWIAHASYDIDIKNIFKFPPAHEIDKDLDGERGIVVKDLTGAGAVLRGFVVLQQPHSGVNAFGDEFETDGRAAVLEMK